MSQRSAETTERSELKQVAKYGTRDRRRIDEILDEGMVCHVGFAVDGQPFVIPMGYGRDGDRLLLHGSIASRLMGHLRAGAEVCVAVTLLDGLVVARSGFSSSMNYRSVVLFGTGRPIEEEEAKARALDALTDHLLPGRSGEYRKHLPKELAATEVIEIPLTEASAKISEGPPDDLAKDRDLPIWAGLLPLSLRAGEPEPAPDLPDGLEVPPSVRDWHRPGPDGRG